MSEPFLGMIIIVPYNFAPRGWAFCQGQTLSIGQNTALFSLIGTAFGGDGQTTFKLPDLRGRVPNGAGQGPGLSPYNLGQVGGTESTTLTVNNMPVHSHQVSCLADDANAASPGGNILANAPNNVYATVPPTATMNPVMIGTSGGSQPFEILGPFLTLNFCIALEGIYPSRN
jgi:microcystin-dependent protein